MRRGSEGPAATNPPGKDHYQTEPTQYIAACPPPAWYMANGEHRPIQVGSVVPAWARRMTAVHEAGHAIAGSACGIPVHSVRVFKRARLGIGSNHVRLGCTRTTPLAELHATLPDTSMYGARHMLLTGGGHAAEALAGYPPNDATTGEGMAQMGLDHTSHFVAMRHAMLLVLLGDCQPLLFALAERLAADGPALQAAIAPIHNAWHTQSCPVTGGWVVAP